MAEKVVRDILQMVDIRKQKSPSLGWASNLDFKNWQNLQKLVGLSGLEPLTPTMSRLRAKTRNPLIIVEKQPFCSAKNAEKSPKQTLLNQKHIKTALLYIAIISPLFRVRAALKVLCFISVCLCANAANADDYLYLGAWSHHFRGYPQKETPKTIVHSEQKCRQTQNDILNNSTHCVTVIETHEPAPAEKEPTFNNKNNLIGYSHNNWGVGYFINSFGQDTFFAERQFKFAEFHDFNFSLNVGAVYGYRGCDYKNRGNLRICPNVNLEVAFSKLSFQPVLIIQGDALSISSKFKF